MDRTAAGSRPCASTLSEPTSAGSGSNTYRVPGALPRAMVSMRISVS